MSIVPYLGAMTTRSGRNYGLQYAASRIANWAGPRMARRAVARRQQYARSRTLTLNRRRRQTRSGQGITTQHDERRIYQKRSMPRFKRRRWKRFKNKVLAISEKDLGTRTVVFNKNYNWQNTTANNHTAGNVALYGARSANPYLNDLAQIQSDEVGVWTAATGEVIDATSKFIFKSAILDITFRNSSTFTADGITFNPDSRAKLETDVYEIIMNHDGNDFSATYVDLFAMLQQGLTDTSNIGGAGTGVNMSLRGVTPFDAPAALSRFKIKVLKKTKFMTPNGDTFTYQVRDPRRHVMNRTRLNTIGCNVPGWTRWVLFISKLVPGLTIGVAANTFQESLDVGLTRKYFYKIEGVNEDRDNWLNV